MINLVIADDHSVLRQALGEMLKRSGDYNLVGSAADGEELMELLKTQRPDVVIMDMTMPKLDGVQTLERMRQFGINVPVLVLSANEGERNVRAAMKAGACGYVPKNVTFDELKFAISSVLSGKTYLSPGITGNLVGGGDKQSLMDNPLSVLTKRELEILKYLADGKPNREIGKELHISTRTVDTHRSNILRKLKLKTNAELVKLAIANDLINV